MKNSVDPDKTNRPIRIYTVFKGTCFFVYRTERVNVKVEEIGIS